MKICKKIPCGGFYLDNTLKVDENNTLGIAPGVGGVQSDWNVNDESNLAYVKNRICYESFNPLIEQISISCTNPLTEADGYYTTIYYRFHSMQNENVFEVIYDGVPYIVECPYLQNEIRIDSFVFKQYVGDPYLVDFPFAIDFKSDQNFVFTKTSGEHTFVVNTYSVKQIDQKYIPSELFKVTSTVDEGNKLIADKTFAEIQEAYEAGKYIYATVYPQVYNLEYADNNAFVFSARNGSFINQVTVNDDNSLSFERFFVLPIPTEHDNNKTIRAVDGTWKLSNELILPSSTPDSTKQFKITVDDSGAITATEITT